MRTIEHIMNDIHKQFPLWPVTYSTCYNDDCEKSSRGGRRCLDCLQDELAALTNNEDAGLFVQACTNLHNIKRRLLHA